MHEELRKIRKICSVRMRMMSGLFLLRWLVTEALRQKPEKLRAFGWIGEG